jgi:hypothetical protein
LGNGVVPLLEPLGVGVGVGLGVPTAGVGVVVGVGVVDGVGVELGLCFFSTEDTARPCEDLLFFVLGLLVFFVPGFLALLVFVAEGVGDGDVVVVGVGTSDAIAMTCRKRSKAVWPIVLSTWSWPPPGTETTMLSLPCVFTLAPPTPRPLARSRMMLTAWFSALFVTLPPRTGEAVSVASVPPRRSSPSAGVFDGPRNTPR